MVGAEVQKIGHISEERGSSLVVLQKYFSVVLKRVVSDESKE